MEKTREFKVEIIACLMAGEALEGVKNKEIDDYLNFIAHYSYKITPSKYSRFLYKVYKEQFPLFFNIPYLKRYYTDMDIIKLLHKAYGPYLKVTYSYDDTTQEGTTIIEAGQACYNQS